MKRSKLTKAHLKRGYSMLEYAAGAAIILVILYSAMNLLGGGVNNLFSSIDEWAGAAGNNLRQNKPVSNP